MNHCFSDYDIWKTMDPSLTLREFYCDHCGHPCVEGEDTYCPLMECPVIDNMPANEEFCDD